MVTGGSRGLGKAIVLRLAEEGCSLAICARGEEALDEVAEKVRGIGRQVCPQSLDVTVRGGVEVFVERAAQQLRGLDILVNNVGGNRRPSVRCAIHRWRGRDRCGPCRYRGGPATGRYLAKTSPISSRILRLTSMTPSQASCSNTRVISVGELPMRHSLRGGRLDCTLLSVNRGSRALHDRRAGGSPVVPRVEPDRRSGAGRSPEESRQAGP